MTYDHSHQKFVGFCITFICRPKDWTWGRRHFDDSEWFSFGVVAAGTLYV